MSTATEGPYPFTGDCGKPCVRVPAEELTSGDTIDSHDGLRHEVDAVAHYDDGLVVINVRRSDGSTYSTEFDPDHQVAVIA